MRYANFVVASALISVRLNFVDVIIDLSFSYSSRYSLSFDCFFFLFDFVLFCLSLQTNRVGETVL